MVRDELSGPERGRPALAALILGGAPTTGTAVQLRSPADPGDVISVATASPEQVAAAAALANAVRPEWAARSRAERA
jgi:delta 1-pyrroline-5-carboxylate dehydrogenase